MAKAHSAAEMINSKELAAEASLSFGLTVPLCVLLEKEERWEIMSLGPV